MVYFSVIIPLYNKEKAIKNTIESVLEQTIAAYEIIIVNDGSTDNSLSIAHSIKDDRINIISTKNQGVSSARNTGAKHSNYQHLAFLDADDYWYPGHLEKLTQLIDNFPLNKWYATAYAIEHNKKCTLPPKNPLANKKDERTEIIEDYFANSMIDALAWTSAVCMKKDFFNVLGGFDIRLKNTEDTDLWIRAALKSPLVYSNSITAIYKLSSENHISKTNIQQKTILDLDKYENLHHRNKSLKKYLDYNRYSFALRFKIAGDDENFKTYNLKIERNNLTFKQRLLLRMPKFFLKIIFALKKRLEKQGLRLRSS